MGYETIEKIIDTRKVSEQNFDIILKPRFGLNRQKAIRDIKNGEINILELGGIGSTLYKSDLKFSKKYNVNFIQYGCEDISEESLYQYNQTVFEYLDEKYGEKWRKEIRRNIVKLK